HRERAIGAPQSHELGALLGRQPIVAPALVDVGLLEPVVQGRVGDPELFGDVCNRALTQPRKLYRTPPELGWVPGSHLGLLPGRPNRHSLGVRETGSGSHLLPTWHAAL